MPYLIDSAEEQLDAATQETLNRLRSFKQTVTPEERKILGVDEEALAAFAEIQSPQDVRAAIQEILEEAIKNVPAFKQLVDEDLKTEPERLSRTSRIVSNLLRHIQGIVQPSAAGAVRADRQRQAQEIMKNILRRQARTPQPAPEGPDFENYDPIKPNDLALFGLSTELLTPKKTTGPTGQEVTEYPIAQLKGSQMKRPLLFFLNRLKEEKEGKTVTVKNEATKKMSDDMKKDMIYRLFRTIRDSKIQQRGDIGPEVSWLGKSDKNLRQIIDGYVEKAAPKDPPHYTHDPYAVYEDAQGLLSTIRRVQERLGGTDATSIVAERMKELSNAVDSALPSPANVEDKVKEIQEEVSRLRLTQDEMKAALHMGDAHIYQPMTDERSHSDLGASLKKLQDKLKEKGPSEGLITDIKNAERQYRAVGSLVEKDTSHLHELVSQYMNLLQGYKDRAQKNLSAKGTDVISGMDELVKQVADMARQFGRLSKEEFFRGRWNRPGGRMMRAPKSEPAPEQEPGALTAIPSETPEGHPELKLASDIRSYATKVQEFRGTGPAAALEFLREAVSDGLLDELDTKILSIMEAKPRSGMNPSETDYTGNPLAGQGSTIDDVVKAINKMRAVVGKFKPELLFDEAVLVLNFAANLPALIKAPKRAPKKAMIASVLRSFLPEFIFKFAEEDTEVLDEPEVETVPEEKKKKPSTFMKTVPLMYRTPTAYYKLTKEEWNALPEEERQQKHEAWKKIVKKKVPQLFEERAEREKQKPGSRPRGEPSTQPIRPAAPAGIFIHGERTTPLGLKYLKDMFVEPDFVPEFIEAMEKEGLNRMLLEGGDVKAIEPGEADKTLARIMSKGSKAEGGETLGNILSTKAVRFAEEEYQIKKTREDMEGARKSISDKNKAIVEIGKKHFGKIVKFLDFLAHPMESVREHLERIEPRHRKTKGPGEKLQRLLDRIDDRRARGDYQLAGKGAPVSAQPTVKSERVTDASILAVLSGMARRYGLQKEPTQERQKSEEHIRQQKDETVKAWKGKNAAEAAVLKTPTQVFREVLVTKKRLQDLKQRVDIEKDEVKRARLAKNFYAYALEQQREHGEYLSSVIEPQMSADLETLQSAEDFLGSDASANMKAAARSQAQELIDTLRDGFEKETKALGQITDYVEERKDPSATYIKELQTVEEDLKDGQVQRLYEVAMSPEMTHGTPEERATRERQRQRQKDIGYTMDLSTFKRKMQILLTEYKQSPGLKPAPGEEKTKVFPKERLEEMRQKNEADQKKIDEISRIQDARNKSFQLAHFYENQIKTVEALQKELATTKQVISLLEKAVELLSGIPSELSDEEKLQNVATIKSIIVPIAKLSPSVSEEITEKTQEMKPGDSFASIFKTKLEDEKRALTKYEEAVGEAQTHIADYRQKAKQYAEQAASKGPVPQGPVEDVPGRPAQSVPYGTTTVQAGQDVYGPQKSPYDVALETRGKMPEYTRDIPRPKGFDVLEGFLTDAKEELKILENVKVTGKDLDEIPPEVTEGISERLTQLDRLIPAIAQYKDQVVEIDGTRVPLKEVATKLEDMVSDYMGSTNKIVQQRDNVIERLKGLRQKLRQHEEFIDPDTGEYKDLSEAEKKSMKKIFFRLLYRDLDKYWATKVGKNVDVFGERDTQWYDNVFRTFQTIDGVRSNRKLMSLLNRYKSELYTETKETKFMVPVDRDRVQELEKRKKSLENRYAVLGEDAKRSPEIARLEQLVSQIKKQKKQMDVVFTEMAQAVQAQVNTGIQDAVAEAAGGKPQTKSNLSEQSDKNVQEAEAALDIAASADQVPQHELAEEAAQLMDRMEQQVEQTEQADQGGATAEKEAALRHSPHFDAKILYGPVMQKKIEELLSKE